MAAAEAVAHREVILQISALVDLVVVAMGPRATHTARLVQQILAAVVVAREQRSLQLTLRAGLVDQAS